MGTFIKGILGRFKGIVGSVVGARWKDRTVMRSRPEPRAKGSASPKQLEQQAKFAVMMRFLRPLLSLLNQTFEKAATGMSGFNKAFAYNIVQAITGTYPNFTVDYAKVQISQGGRAGSTATCTSPQAGKLVFNWIYSPAMQSVGDDFVFVAAFSPELNHWVYDLASVQRKDGTLTLDLTGLSGKSFHTYIGFISGENGMASNSFYTGLVAVA